MSTHHSVLHDPEGLLDDLPLDREPLMLMVSAVLAVTDPEALAPGDCELIALLLTGQARLIADDVRRRLDQLAKGAPRTPLAEIVLREARGRLSQPSKGTLRCVHNRARLVRCLYERLDRLEAVAAPPS
jgi:hypothetical protein